MSWCAGLTHEVLRRLFPEQFPTGSRAKKYCRKHRVFVDGKRANTTANVDIGQQVVVRSTTITGQTRVSLDTSRVKTRPPQSFYINLIHP